MTLIIEDSYESLLLYARILDYRGIPFEVAVSRGEALEIFHGHAKKIRLVLMDDRLEEEQTEQSLARELKALNPELRIILLSEGASQSGDPTLFDVRINKPVGIDQLDHLLESEISRLSRVSDPEPS